MNLEAHYSTHWSILQLSREQTGKGPKGIGVDLTPMPLQTPCVPLGKFTELVKT